MFDDILLLYICLKLLDVLLVTLSWKLPTVHWCKKPGAVETSVAKGQSANTLLDACIYIYIYML